MMKASKKAFIKIKKLNYMGLFSESNVYNYEVLIGKKTSLFRYRGTGWLWTVWGLGLSKMERHIFNHPFLHPQSTITIYLGKIGLSIDQIGNGKRLSGYMVWEMPFRDWIAYQIKRIWYDRIKMWGQRWINRFFHIFHHTTMVFVVERSYESLVTIRTDVLTAYQLASNYEADLYLYGKGLIFSPLGLDDDMNNQLIQKYLGFPFRIGHFFGYADYSDVEILDNVYGKNRYMA